jgi:hypothetical protein
MCPVVPALAACNGNGQGGLNGFVAGQILWRNGLLKPTDVELFDEPTE